MDRLTQLQSAVDALATQFYSALAYLSGDSLFSDGNDGASRTNTATPDTAAAANNNNNHDIETGRGKKMIEVQDELGNDIISRAKQIDLLINALPGIGLSKSNQLDKVSHLQHDIDTWTHNQVLNVKSRQSLLTGCDNIIVQLSLGLANVDG